jgi:NADH-quinone oxidoreductase subunit H
MTAWFQTQLGFGAGWFVANTILILLIALPLMLAVAMIIYADRKIWAAMALRKGPNVVGPFGLLQSFADGLKVFLQETIIPTSANRGLFLLAPIITFTVALIVWAVVPFGPGMVLSDINVGLLYILAASSLGVYGVMMAGWSSNSKYPFYSALRAAAQMVSYEVSIGFVLISVVLWVGSFNMTAIVEMQRSHLWITNGFGFNPLFLPMAVVFFISSLAETARAPFDLTEAESELVAGYQTEYSSMSFALFWLGEYANVILMCALNAILFWGGYLPPIDWAPLYLIPGIFWLFLKILVFFFLFSWVKATVPRYRYDQLMRLGWKIFLPISLLWVVLVSGYLMLTRYSTTHDATAKVTVPTADRYACWANPLEGTPTREIVEQPRLDALRFQLRYGWTNEGSYSTILSPDGWATVGRKVSSENPSVFSSLETYDGRSKEFGQITWWVTEGDFVGAPLLFEIEAKGGSKRLVGQCSSAPQDRKKAAA